MKTTPCTQENKILRLNLAPRCHAKTRAGTLCQSPAVKNRPRCRLHGCAKNSGAPKGNMNALTHGYTTAEAKAFRKYVRQTIAEASNSLFTMYEIMQND